MVLGIPVVILSQGSQSREKNEDFCRMALERSLTWSAKPQGWFSVAEEEFPRSRVGKSFPGALKEFEGEIRITKIAVDVKRRSFERIRLGTIGNP